MGTTAIASTRDLETGAGIGVTAPILVATDGSKDSRVALRIAADLARRSSAPLHIVHAWMEPVRYDYMYGLPSTLEFGDEARALLDREVRRAVRAGVRPEGAHLVTGRPGWTAESVAAETNAALLVVGTRGLGAVGRLLLGSVSGELVQHAPCPVLVCHGDLSSWPPTRVVVGDDFSEDSFSAAVSAAAIAEALERPISLVHTIPARYASGDTPGDVRRRQDAAHVAARALTTRARRLEAVSGVEVTTEVSIGDAATELLRRDGRSGLIAVGRRGRGMVTRTLLGSVSTKVLRAARGPVLVVPPGSHT